MEGFVKAAVLTDIPEGTMKTIRVAGKRIALACIEGEYYAIDDTCTHANCSLGTSGFLDGTAVICGCHGAQFDVTTGDVLTPPASSPVTAYQVEVQGADIYIKV